MKIPSMTEMLKAGVHFGHKTSKRHPSMESNVYLNRNGVSIIDLSKTTEMLDSALKFLQETRKKGGVILFVGSKKQAQPIVEEYAKKADMPFITGRWPGGLVTNFSEIYRTIKKLRDMRSKMESGEYNKYTKKEQLEIKREIDRMEKLIGGIVSMDKIPDAVFIVDLKQDKTAFRECVKKNVPIVAIADTNTNINDVDYPIAANDDAVKSITMLTSLVADTIASTSVEKKAEPAPKKKAEAKKTKATK